MKTLGDYFGKHYSTINRIVTDSENPSQIISAKVDLPIFLGPSSATAGLLDNFFSITIGVTAEV